jgi:hypothetical protein
MSKKKEWRVGANSDSKTPRGRPPVHREAWAKVSVVLFERQIANLDGLTDEFRRKSGKKMTRAGIIRALIDGLISSRIDITTKASEAALRTYIASRLARYGQRRERADSPS